jgi:hypothetical protein
MSDRRNTRVSGRNYILHLPGQPGRTLCGRATISVNVAVSDEPDESLCRLCVARACPSCGSPPPQHRRDCPVPRRDSARSSPRLSGVSVPREVYDALHARAEKLNTSVSSIVTVALRAWLGLK